MKPTYKHEDIKFIKKEIAYDGFFKLEKWKFISKLFNGKWSEETNREVFERTNAVFVIPYDPIQDKLVLIEQLRIPAFCSNRSPWLLELVAGMISAKEDPIAVAKKELYEETKIIASTITHIGDYFLTPGGSSEKGFFYLATIDINTVCDDNFYGLEEEGEDIKLHIVTREQAYNLIKKGDIENLPLVMGIQWLMLNTHN